MLDRDNSLEVRKLGERWAVVSGDEVLFHSSDSAAAHAMRASVQSILDTGERLRRRQNEARSFSGFEEV